MAYLLKKEEFPYFIEHLISKARVVAPVIDKKDIMSRFTVLKKGEGSKVVFDTPLSCKGFLPEIRREII